MDTVTVNRAPVSPASVEKYLKSKMGEAGWGAKGTLSLARIVALVEKAKTQSVSARDD